MQLCQIAAKYKYILKWNFNSLLYRRKGNGTILFNVSYLHSWLLKYFTQYIH